MLQFAIHYVFFFFLKHCGGDRLGISIVMFLLRVTVRLIATPDMFGHLSKCRFERKVFNIVRLGLSHGLDGLLEEHWVGMVQWRVYQISKVLLLRIIELLI